MILIFFGATGSIGKNVLTTALADPRISEILIVSRRAIPHLDAHSKAKVIVLKDFSAYPPELVAQLAVADACIWCLGTYNGDEKVEVEYPRVFFDALTGGSGWKEGRKDQKDRVFRMVYLGGAFTETDQARKLWFLDTARKVRGKAQTMVLGWAEKDEVKGLWRSVVVRPGGVLPPAVDQNVFYRIGAWLFGESLCVGVDELGQVMVEDAVGGEGESVVENKQIVLRGRELFARQKGDAGRTQ